MKTAISSRLYFGIELSFFGLSTERRISIWNSSEDDLLSKMHIKSIVSDLKLSFFYLFSHTGEYSMELII